MARKILMRSDTTTNWESADPTLGIGEIGYDTDVKQLKVGDGATTWSALPFTTDHAHTDLVTESELSTILDGYQAELSSSTVISVSNTVCTTASITTDIDWNTALGYKTLSGAGATFTFSNAANGKSVSFVIVGDGSDRAVAWPAGIKWVGTSHTTVKANKSNFYSFVQVNSVVYGTVISDMA